MSGKHARATGADAAALAAILEREAARLLDGYDEVLAFEFPDYGNVGDSAIWLGMTAILRRLGKRIAYTVSCRERDFQDLGRRVGTRSALVVNGGGNVGDLWPKHQANLERLLAAFPDNRIVHFPQSVFFASPHREAEALRAMAGHPSYFLMVRDRGSEGVALRGMPRERVVLCPDAAFALGALRPIGRPVRAIQYLIRTDQESVAPAGTPAGSDWRKDDRLTRAVRTLRRRLERIVPEGARGALRGAFFALLARLRLRRGVAHLCRGERVITDRLHGHILCCLLGKEHAALDNSYGKVGACIHEWTATWKGVHLMSSRDEAERLFRV
jgi:exopolysaccharide biosynthesis predicted pyruvyltransferase EpsI